MPAKSKAQFRFMKMMEHNPEKAKTKGISPSQAAEFTQSNKGKKSFGKLPEKKKNKDHFAPHLDHPQLKDSYPGSKITGKCLGGKFCK